jgi:hypothetical protein
MERSAVLSDIGLVELIAGLDARSASKTWGAERLFDQLPVIPQPVAGVQ